MAGGQHPAVAASSLSVDQVADLFARWEVQPQQRPVAPQPNKPNGDVRQWYRSLCMASSGVLYGDPYLQVVLKSSFQGPSGQISLYFMNKHTQPLQDLVCTVRPTPALSIHLGAVPADLKPFEQVVVPLSVACSAPFTRPPVLQLGYTLAGSGQVASVTLDLPVVLTKFCTPVEVPRVMFAAKWEQVVGPPLKQMQRVTRAIPASLSRLANLLASVNLATLPVLGSEPSIVDAACVFHCGTPQARQVPCLVRIEADPADQHTFTMRVATADAATTECLTTQLCQVVTDFE